MIDLGSLGGTLGSAQCANNRGQVTGQSNLAGGLVSHPFFWDHGVMTDIGTFGGDNGFPTWMNNSGAVVGRADLPNGLHHAFLYRDGIRTDLGTLGGNSTATVGRWSTCPGAGPVEVRHARRSSFSRGCMRHQGLKFLTKACK
jgi:probable HAF family extracellular repeat protein